MYTARNQYVTDIDLQNFEMKANDKLQFCIIQKSNLRVLEKIGQGMFFLLGTAISNHYVII